MRDVSAAEFIREYAQHLKSSGQLEVPAWTEHAKNGVAKELAPYSEDWYYTRAAALARRVYLNPGLGVGKLAFTFGQANNNHVTRQHKVKASRKVIRSILIQLENLGVLETIKEDDAEGGEVTKGRRVTSQGRRDLDRIARAAFLKAQGDAAEGEEEED